MPKNVEIKAHVQDWNSLMARVEAAADGPVTVINQDDLYYKTPKGRLKMRLFDDGSGELIFYERPDVEGVKTCTYYVHKTGDPRGLHGVLCSTPGYAGEVKKTRHLYMIGQTRVHLDEVEKLGQFMELEVVLNVGQEIEEGQKIANKIYSQILGLDDRDKISGSYWDLLKQKG